MAYAYSQQKMSYSPIDKNHTSLSSCRLNVHSGFVLTSDQVNPEDYFLVGFMGRTHISHGFLCIWGLFKNLVWITKTKDQNQAIMDQRVA